MNSSQAPRPTIFIIEDDKAILKGLADTLKNENFQVLTADTGREGLDAVKKKSPDLILLDLRLPDMDGYDVCRTLKTNPDTQDIPIIILSTRSETTEKVVGLEMGADDYITKPYNPLELLARIRTRLRSKVKKESSKTESIPKFQFGPLVVDDELHKITLSNKIIKLTPKEYDLLLLLISKPGKPFSRQTIMGSIWNETIDSLFGTVDTHIKNLRKKLGPAGKYLETVSGIGYRWAEEE